MTSTQHKRTRVKSRLKKHQRRGCFMRFDNRSSKKKLKYHWSWLIFDWGFAPPPPPPLQTPGFRPRLCLPLSFLPRTDPYLNGASYCWMVLTQHHIFILHIIRIQAPQKDCTIQTHSSTSRHDSGFHQRSFFFLIREFNWYEGVKVNYEKKARHSTKKM